MILLQVNTHDIQETYALLLLKSSQGSCRVYAKSCFFLRVFRFFCFCFLFFLTWLANCICCILLKKVPFMLNKYD